MRNGSMGRRIASGGLMAVLVFLAAAGCGGAKLQANASEESSGTVYTVGSSRESGSAAAVNGSGANRYQLAEAAYPGRPPYPDRTENMDYDAYSKIWEVWVEEQRSRSRLTELQDTALQEFARNTTRQFLSGSQEKNPVYSPVNLYLALAMLAETTDGQSRQQILDVLEVGTIEDLRTMASVPWNLCYEDDGTVTSLPAGSIWLRNDRSYNQETLDRLAGQYYTSAFQGPMGTEAYNQALQSWLNEHTGNLLQEQASDIKTKEDTELALASTMYYRAKWTDEFQEANTRDRVFYGKYGNQVYPFLNKSESGHYYWGDQFTAVSQDLHNSGSMWLILPDEGVAVEELLLGKEVFELLQSRTQWEKQKYMIVNLSVPKFDVVSDMDLLEELKKLGITDVLNADTADFSPLAGPDAGIFLSQADHAARVKVDEYGVEAAAYTVVLGALGAIPPEEEVDFVLDRPFLFVITSRQGLPLFCGIVQVL